MICPKCGAEDCRRDSADVGVGVMYGPYGCPCGWSQDPRFDIAEGPKFEEGYRVDQWGGLTPTVTRPYVDADEFDEPDPGCRCSTTRTPPCAYCESTTEDASDSAPKPSETEPCKRCRIPVAGPGWPAAHRLGCPDLDLSDTGSSPSGGVS